jgi:hypothetical protein
MYLRFDSLHQLQETFQADDDDLATKYMLDAIDMLKGTKLQRVYIYSTSVEGEPGVVTFNFERLVMNHHVDSQSPWQKLDEETRQRIWEAQAEDIRDAPGSYADDICSQMSQEEIDEWLKNEKEEQEANDATDQA